MNPAREAGGRRRLVRCRAVKPRGSAEATALTGLSKRSKPKIPQTTVSTFVAHKAYNGPRINLGPPKLLNLSDLFKECRKLCDSAAETLENSCKTLAFAFAVEYHKQALCHFFCEYTTAHCNKVTNGYL